MARPIRPGFPHPRQGACLVPIPDATERITLTINGEDQALLVEPRRTLLDALRHELELTGTKKVCDMGNCGACTVMVDGRAMYACLLLAIDCDGRDIRTIEGLADRDTLDPLQQAFIEHDAFQCGFCTSGQIMSLRALLDAHPDATEDQIRTAVTGNLCRCGAYPNIVAAGVRAAELARAGSTSSEDRIALQTGGH
jgi:aerobic-type carbon monoxide dehydrogenase small subunit (CoxS/CutS family)